MVDLMPSLKQALRMPEYFQIVPLIVEIRHDIPVMNVLNSFVKNFQFSPTHVIESMNMFAMFFPKENIEELMGIAEIDRLYFNAPNYAFQGPRMPPMKPEDMVDDSGRLLSPEEAREKMIKMTTDGWIPTTEVQKVVHAVELHQKGLSGKGVKVAVLDTGVDLGNPQINGTVAPFPVLQNHTGYDENGHGTHVITTIMGQEYVHPANGIKMQGMAPNSIVSSYKVLGYYFGMGDTATILRGMELAVFHDNQIISMSLGSNGKEDEEEDPMVRYINAQAVENPEIIFVVANGNSGPDALTTGVPAIADKCIAVGSWSVIDGGPAYFSSRGPSIQAGKIRPIISAPGGGRLQSKLRPKENIYSGTSFGSMLDPAGDNIEDGFCAIAGTSMATPCVSGVLALWKELVPELTATDVKRIFKTYGQYPEPRNDVGYGLIDARWIYQAMEQSRQAEVQQE